MYFPVQQKEIACKFPPDNCVTLCSDLTIAIKTLAPLNTRTTFGSLNLLFLIRLYYYVITCKISSIVSLSLINVRSVMSDMTIPLTSISATLSSIYTPNAGSTYATNSNASDSSTRKCPSLFRKIMFQV